MKDNEKISFTITDINGKICKYTSDYYCFKSNVSHVYVYYSYLEGVWVFILLNGWIKINNKVIENVPLYFCQSCILNFDNKVYNFQSYKNKEDSTSKIISEAICSSDNKKINISHVKYFLRDIKKIKDVDAYYNILLYNEIFEVDTNNIWNLNYYLFGIYKHLNIGMVLYKEFEYKLGTGTVFEIIDITEEFNLRICDKVKNMEIEPTCNNKIADNYNYIVNNTVHYHNKTISIIEYIYYNIKDYLSDTNKIKIANENAFEIYKLWINVYFPYDTSVNTKKRKLEGVDEIIIKKRCVYRENKEEQIISTVVYQEMEHLRDCFTDIEPNKKNPENKKNRKRSHSLIEDTKYGTDKLWMFDRKSHDI